MRGGRARFRADNGAVRDGLVVRGTASSRDRGLHAPGTDLIADPGVGDVVA